MADIQFTDSAGAVTLTNGRPGVGSRFTAWTPTIERIADRRFALGSGVAYEFLFREDSRVSFTLDGLPATQLENVARFTRHLYAGNTVVLNTSDNSNRSYTCRLAEGAEVQLSMTDPTFLEYSLSVTLANAQTPVVFMPCEYL